MAEGERLEAQPSLGALQVWLQLSDDLLSTAWGSMDRYHLAWLMVGKPKGIVRGRRDDRRRGGRLRPRGRDPEDGGAADEPRRRRATGHAVRRGDRRRGRRCGRRPRPVRSRRRTDRPAARPGPRTIGWPRPGARPTPIGTTTRRARRGRPDAAVTVARPLVSAVGGTRHGPEPDPIARDYLLLALRLDQHAPGLVDGYFGPAALKAQVDMEQLRPPARLRDDAVGAACTPGGRGRGAGSAGVAGRATRRPRGPGSRPSPATPLPYADHVARCMGFAPPRRPDVVFDAARVALDDALPGAGSLAERLEAWDRTMEIPLDGVPVVVDGLVARFRARAAADFGLPDGEDLRVRLVTGPAVERLQLVRRRSSLAGRDQHRPAGPGALARSTRSPTRRTPAITWSTPGRKPTWSTLGAASRRASCSSTRRSARSARAWPTSACASPTHRTTGSTCSCETCRASRAGDRDRSGRRPDGGGASRGHRHAPHHAQRGAWQRGLSAPRRRREPR